MTPWVGEGTVVYLEGEAGGWGGNRRSSRPLYSTRWSNWVQYNQNGEVFYIKNGDMSTKQDMPVRLVAAVYSLLHMPCS